MKRNRIKSTQDTVIVFGGSGFVGSHVADALSDAGFKVRIFDKVHSPYLRHDQTMIVGDILSSRDLFDAVKGCRYVYNFAGIADLDDATTRPIDTIQLNIAGNTLVMEAAKQSGVERLIYASTIYVYSQKGGFYRCSKQAAELYIEEYQRKFDLDYTILRFGTLYGPRTDERNSIYRYLHEALTQGTIHIKGTGNEVRDYVHVRDAARLSVEILKDEYRNRHLIISGHHPIKFSEMITMVQEILDGKVKPVYSNETNPAHYTITPYSYTPKIGYKLTDHLYLDMGQGLLECLQEISEKMAHCSRSTKHKSKLSL